MFLLVLFKYTAVTFLCHIESLCIPYIIAELFPKDFLFFSLQLTIWGFHLHISMPIHGVVDTFFISVLLMYIYFQFSNNSQVFGLLEQDLLYSTDWYRFFFSCARITGKEIMFTLIYIFNQVDNTLLKNNMF